MNKYFYLLILASITLFACKEAKPKAIAGDPKIDSVPTKHSDSTAGKDSYDYPPGSVKADDYYDNFPSPFVSLIGCWAALREGNVTITFSTDSTFEFYDYNDKMKKKELLTGKFEVEGSTLLLLYNDRPEQRFSFKQDPQANNEYRITNVSGYYFIKSQC